MRLNCKYQKKCNSCHLYNLDYEDQLKLKNKKIRLLFDHICKVMPIIGMDYPFEYRNKAQIVFKENEKKEYLPGLYKSTTKSVMPCSQCLLHTKRQNEIANALAPLLKSFKIRPYDFHTSKGWLKSVLIREGFKTGEIILVLIGSSKVFPAKPTFISALLKKCPYITTVVTTVNETDILMTGRQTAVLYGEGHIHDSLLNKDFIISADSFYQINPVQTEKLYQTAVSFADIQSNNNVLDAYCGIGTIGIIAAEKAEKIISIEINKSAVENAEKNAKLNNIDNITVLQGDVKDHISSLKDIDIAFIDPPRAGCSREFIKSLVNLKPEKIIYISCNPKTQIRDIKLLRHYKYYPRLCQPVDMFPHTNHVETVVLLDNKNLKPKDYIEIGIDAEDYYKIKNSENKS